MNPTAILALIADLYEQVTEARAASDALRVKNSELHAACADLQREVARLTSSGGGQ